MPPRFHVPLPLAAGAEIELPEGASRHVQVLRLQPGDALTLFDGRGGEWAAQVRALVEAGAIGTPVTLAPGQEWVGRQRFAA